MFWNRPAPRKDDLPFAVDPKRINQLVGCTALFLPLVLALTALSETGCFMTSISHFYYTRIGGDILVGALTVIGVTLIAFYQYKGDESAENRAHSFWNAIWARVAGLCALGVAFFPTSFWGCAYSGREVSRFLLTGTRVTGPDPAQAYSIYDKGAAVTGTATDDFWASFGIWPTAGDIPWLIHSLHYLSAAGMFLILGYFSMFVFTGVQSRYATTSRSLDGPITSRKWRRNALYRAMGGLIFLSIGGLAVKLGMLEWWYRGDPDAARAFLIGWDRFRLTFVFETVALVAFGFSWMVKGRLIPGLDDLVEEATAA
jgi:hypothetical protein